MKCAIVKQGRLNWQASTRLPGMVQNHSLLGRRSLKTEYQHNLGGQKVAGIAFHRASTARSLPIAAALAGGNPTGTDRSIPGVRRNRAEGAEQIKAIPDPQRVRDLILAQRGSR